MAATTSSGSMNAKKTALIQKIYVGGQQAGDEMWQRMVRYACERQKSVSAGMNDWRQELARCRREALGDMQDRITKREGKIFDLSNESMGLAQGAAEFVRARIKEDVFGSEPWFQVVPELVSPVADKQSPDEELATQIDEHGKWKLREIGWKSAGRDAIDNAVDLGTALLKSTHKRKVKEYWKYANVLVHAAQPGEDARAEDEAGEAVTTQAGDYIFDTDPVDTQVQTAGEGQPEQWEHEDDARTRMHTDVQQQEGYDPAAVEAAHSAMPWRKVARKDVSVVVDTENEVDDKGKVARKAAHRWEQWLIRQETVLWDDPVTEVVHEMNFAAPFGYARLEDCDFCSHSYDLRYSDIKRMLDPKDPETDEILRLCRGETADRKAEDRQGGAKETGDEDNPPVRVAETYFDYDPFKDGNTTRIYLVTLPQHERGIKQGCDFLANVTPGAKYPFSSVTIFKRRGEWRGVGFFEMFRAMIRVIERNFNAITYRNDIRANPVIGFHPDAAAEEIETITAAPGATYELKNDKTLKDLIEVLEIPDTDERTWKVVEMLINLFQLRSTVSSAAQGSVADLPEVNTATGINSVLASGSTLTNELMEQIKGEVGVDGLLDHLEKTIELLYTHLNRAETFAYGDGEFRQIMSLTPAQVQGLKMKVHLLLTRFKQKQDTDNAQAAMQAVLQYIQLPEQEKAAVRTLVVQIVKGHGFDNADAIVREPIEQDPNQRPQTPPESLSINYKDAPPDVRRQMEEKAGFTPSTMEDGQETEGTETTASAPATARIPSAAAA